MSELLSVEVNFTSVDVLFRMLKNLGTLFKLAC